MTGTKSPEYKN